MAQLSKTIANRNLFMGIFTINPVNRVHQRSAMELIEIRPKFFYVQGNCSIHAAFY